LNSKRYGAPLLCRMPRTGVGVLPWCSAAVCMQAMVEATIDGYCRHHRLTPADQEHVPDALRFRPVVTTVREFAASVDTGKPLNPAVWWRRYAEADVVSAYAQ
jgi:hypothetical protein